MITKFQITRLVIIDLAYRIRSASGVFTSASWQFCKEWAEMQSSEAAIENLTLYLTYLNKLE